MLLFDGHLDLAMNALDWNRDLTLHVAQIRQAEAGMEGKGRAAGTVSLPEMRQGDVGLCLATVLARIARPGNPLPGYSHPAAAYAAAQGHLAYYRALEAGGWIRIITDWPGLAAHVEQWERDRAHTPIGVILSMEGADPVIAPDQLEAWWQAGLRVVGLAHYGVSTYAHGTGVEGGLFPPGRELLGEMRRLGMVLDLTHLADQSFWEALEVFDGPVIASHNNCRALVPHQRQFSDDQIRAIIARDGVIGAALDAWMLYPGWVKGETENTVVSLAAVADHIDHICQLAGDARHAAIGTDLDGGFGREQTPHDVDTIADLQRLRHLLAARGYSEEDLRALFHGNWIRCFERAWHGSQAAA
ncbi:MAG TPA: membrane dipeptidase [Limnochordia bacterium]